MKFLVQIAFVATTVILGSRSWGTPLGEQSRPPQRELEIPRKDPVYQLNPAYDTAAILIGGIVASSWLLGDEFGSAYCAPLCEKNEVNPIDRFAAGNYNQTWARISDATLITSIVSGLFIVGLDEGFPAALTDGLVVIESVLLTNGAIVLLNVATRRPRPYVYTEKTPKDKREQGVAAFSFPSGHVGATAALATAVFGILHIRHPKSPWKWVFLGVGAIATGVVATGRILSGRHFLTDVVAGAAIGVGMGILVPALHKRNFSIMPTVSSNGIGFGLLKRF